MPTQQSGTRKKKGLKDLQESYCLGLSGDQKKKRKIKRELDNKTRPVHGTRQRSVCSNSSRACVKLTTKFNTWLLSVDILVDTFNLPTESWQLFFLWL